MIRANSTFRRFAWLLVALLSLQAATPCQAGLFDWLRRRPTQTVVCCQPPTCGSCCQNRTIVNYAPQTVYTTNWVRVPVTTYRPVATTDPTTCCRVTYMQPSTSYVWQAQRRPHILYRPFLSRVANACGSCSAPSTVAPYNAAPAGSIAVPGTVAPLVPAAGAPAANVNVPGVVSPYPASPYPTSPYPASPYAVPGTVPNAVSPVPAPGVLGAPPAGGAADTRPRLDPNLTVPQTTERPALPPTLPPIGDSFPAIPSAPATTTPSAPLLSAPAGSVPLTTLPAEGTSVLTPSIPTLEPPRASTAPYVAPPTGPAPNPVPDPNASRAPSDWPAPSSPRPAIPRLLNPSDRTASLRPRIATPVSWVKTARPPQRWQSAVVSSPVRERSSTPQVDLRQPARPLGRVTAPALNDQGWRSAQ